MDNPILFAQVKRKLNVTWDDPDTTTRIEEIMGNAVLILLHKLGIADPNFDFSVAGYENELFKAYCLYEWNHATAEFDLNYERMIADVRAIHEVEHYLANEGSTNAEV